MMLQGQQNIERHCVEWIRRSTPHKRLQLHPTESEFKLPFNLKLWEIPAKPIFRSCGSTTALTLKEDWNHFKNKNESAARALLWIIGVEVHHEMRFVVTTRSRQLISQCVNAKVAPTLAKGVKETRFSLHLLCERAFTIYYELPERDFRKSGHSTAFLLGNFSGLFQDIWEHLIFPGLFQDIWEHLIFPGLFQAWKLRKNPGLFKGVGTLHPL